MRNFILFVLVLILPLSLSATIRNVPSTEYPTIQAGIDSALTGDTVLVAEGLYYENIFFRGKEITVASQFIMDQDTSHISKTFIDGSQHTNPDSGTVVYFIDGETIRSILYGFTITGGSGSLATDWYIWHDDTKTEYHGGGILILSGGRIEHNRIINNEINQPTVDVGIGCGSGISVHNSIDSVIIIYNDIRYNNIIAWFGHGAGVTLGTSDGYVLFDKNIVEKNIMNSTGGNAFAAILAGSLSGNVIISRNLIKGNICSNNLGWTAHGGGGIYTQGGSLKIVNNIIMDNSTMGWGGGITLDDHTYHLIKPVVINNVVFNNTANDGGGIWVMSHVLIEQKPILFNNIIWGNAAELDPQISIDGPVHLYNSLIQDPEYANINNGIFCADPLFADTTFCLSELSPCIGRGIASLEINGTLFEAPAFDFDGNPRPSVVDEWIDLGVFESNYSAMVYPTSFNLCDISIPATSGTQHFTSELFNPNADDIQVLCKIYNHDSTSLDSVEMLDDGEHGDDTADDGMYGQSWQTSLEDVFTSAIIVQNNTKGYRYEYGDNQKFTTIGPIKYLGYEIVTTNDDTINSGEKHRLKIKLANLGETVSASNIKVYVTPLDTFANMLNNNFVFDEIPAGDTLLSDNYRTFQFGENFPSSPYSVHFALDISMDGYVFWRDTTSIIVGIESKQYELPNHFSLEQNYPNPFNPKTVIRYAVGAQNLVPLQHVNLSIYNILGQKVATLVNKKQPAGSYQVEWDASTVSSGVYYYRLEAEGYSNVKKMVVLK